MVIDEKKPSSRRRRRVVLMAGTAVVIGLGAIAGVGYQTQFGKHAFHALFARLEDKHKNQSQFAKLMDQARQALAQNHPRVAVIFLKNAVSAAPKDGDAHLQLGVALLRARRYSRSRARTAQRPAIWRLRRARASGSLHRDARPLGRPAIARAISCAR